jgi:hypothetical protein
MPTDRSGTLRRSGACSRAGDDAERGTSDEEKRRMFSSSLPTRVDVEDWLDEDLPEILGALADSVPCGVRADGHPDGYWPVAGVGGADVSGRDRVLAVVADGDESGWQLAGGIGTSLNSVFDRTI